MVKVDVLTDNGCIRSVEMKGHADYAPNGQDLVCAGVSCITFGTLNALNEMASENFKYEVNHAHILIEVENISEQITQIIMKTMVIQLQTIQEQYSKFIKIKMEVSS